MDYKTLLILAIPSAIVHVAEEYKFGWVAWANNFVDGISVRQFLYFNVLFLSLCILAASVSEKYPLFSSSIFSLLLINIAVHFVPTVIQRKYSPGLISAIILYLPIGFLGYRNMLNQNVISHDELLTSIGIGFLWMIVPFIFQATRLVLARKNT